MDYLYFLQQLRQAAPAWISDAIMFVSEIIAGPAGIVVLAVIYWGISKRAGMMLMMNFSMAQVCNNIVKNIFRIERPFNRDPRLTPYVPVTGYSFPSGHTMMATAFYGGVAVWQRKRKWLAALSVFMILLTAFARNWLGAHTPQDVIVGMLASACVIALNCYLLNMVDRRPERDVWVFAGALVLSAAFCVMTPSDMRPAGLYAGVMTGWFIERRAVRFEIGSGWRLRLTTCVLGVAAVFLCYTWLVPTVFASLDAKMMGTINYFLTFLFITAGWPAMIKWIRCRHA